jgi:hypothetical protein
MVLIDFEIQNFVRNIHREIRFDRPGETAGDFESSRAVVRVVRCWAPSFGTLGRREAREEAAAPVTEPNCQIDSRHHLRLMRAIRQGSIHVGLMWGPHAHISDSHKVYYGIFYPIVIPET